MEREKEVAMAGNSGRDAATAGLTVYPLVTQCLTSTAAANGQEPSLIEADPAGRDAPISVWWDHPPGGDPRS
jgi:hypothetical protein